jgi:tetratricopeptide (TPR) repeat protein
MARRAGRSAALLSLLVLLLFAAAAPAAQSPEALAYRAAQSAMDRKDATTAESLIKAALDRSPPVDERWHWELQVLRGRVLCRLNRCTDALRLLEQMKLPPKLATSEPALHRLLDLAAVASRVGDIDAAYARQKFDEAERFAKRHQPALLAEVHAMRMMVLPDDPGAEKQAQLALKLARGNGARGSELDVLHDVAWLYTRRARYSEAVSLFEEIIPQLKAAGRQALMQRALGNLERGAIHGHGQHRPLRPVNAGVQAHRRHRRGPHSHHHLQ